MSAEPKIFSNYEDYLGYEIRTEVFGPIKTLPFDHSDDGIHYSASLAVFFKGEEVEGSRENILDLHPTQDAAEQAAFALGRIMVGQYR